MTEEEMLAYFQRMESRIKGYVFAFCDACGVLNKDWIDDMLQTAHCAFINHLIKIQSVDQIPNCFLNIKHQLTEEMRSRHVVNIPHNIYPEERHKTHGVPLYETDDMDTETFETDVLTEITFQEFVDSLPPDERDVVQRKLLDKPSADELYLMLGVDKPWQLSRRMKRIRRKLDEYWDDD